MRSCLPLSFVLLGACASQAASEPSAAKPEQRCPEGMVLVPAATFMMGISEDNPNDRLHRVTITKPYCIDRTPVTVAAFRKCVDAGVCAVPKRPLDANWGREGRDQHPVNGVDWTNADAYCRWTKKRLPTEAEWELAARGTDGRVLPWGSAPADDTRLWWSDTSPREGTTVVGSLPAGASPYGALDMIGNVSQWVADWEGKFASEPVVDPTGPADGEFRVIRGAAYDTSSRNWDGHACERYGRYPQLGSSTTGFRCAGAPNL